MKKLQRLFPKQKASKRSRSAQIFGFAATGASLAAFVAQANAQTILQDNFTSGSQYGTKLGEQGSNAAGLSPSGANPSGGPWQHVTGAYYDATEHTGNLNGINGAHIFTPVAVACFHNGAASGISLGADNTGSLTFSASLYYIANGGPISSSAYTVAGFASALNSASNYGPVPTAAFTGLEETGTLGSLQEYVNGSQVGSPVAFTGTYSLYTPTNLTYTIDTATGAITGVSFGDSTTSYSNYFGAPGSFSNLYTANIELGGQAGGASVAGVTDLTVSAAGAVPEPGTYGSLAGGMLALGAFQYARRRQRIGV